MALNNWRNANNTQVARVYDVTPANVEATDVFTLTITADDGEAEVISFTATLTTVLHVTAGLTAAWNASTNPLVRKYLAADATTKLTLTARTAGVNPTVASSTTDGGGANTQTLVTTEATVGVGNNNYSQARNWTLDAVPVATNDVSIGGGADQVQDILYGLGQSAVELANFYVLDDFTKSIGRFENGLPYYLKMDLTGVLDYRGRGPLAMFDVGSAAISPYIRAYGNPATGRHAVYLLGSALATVEIAKGNVGIAVHPGETATVTTLLVSYFENAQADSNVTVGSGTTLTTLTQSGGKCKLQCAATTANVAAGAELTTEGSGAITTVNLYGSGFLNSSGTIGTLNVFGKVDFTRDRTARTVTTLNIKPGSEIITHSGITFTTVNVPTDPGSFKWTRVG